MRSTSMIATLAGLLVGLWLLLVLGVGTAILVGHVLARLVRARRDRRHPARPAGRPPAGRRAHKEPQAPKKIAAGCPRLSQPLRLGYTDQWTRQHRFPAAQFTVD